jgi:hypothetical protein
MKPGQPARYDYEYKRGGTQSLFMLFAPLEGWRCDRRIEDQASLEAEVSAWFAKRNTVHAKADWRFTTKDARVKLKNLYPAL